MSTADAATAALIVRLEALRAKTTDRGCTEHEAMAAAAKVAELLDRYSLSGFALDRAPRQCERVEVATDRSRTGPADECGPTVAAFFDCRCWVETRNDGRLIHVFFGLRTDVGAAVHLFGLLGRAFETEGNRFRAAEGYRRGRGGRRRALHTSFMRGLSEGVQVRLAAMRSMREAALRGSPGCDLVVLKASIVDSELAGLGLQFRSRQAPGGQVSAEAYGAGYAVGQSVAERSGIRQGG